MSVVKINALSVPSEHRDELEKRFAARKHAVDTAPGFQSFQLLRPVAGEDRYFVITHWDTEEDFQAWAAQRDSSHGDPQRAPVSSQSALLEFDVVDLD